MLSTCCWALPLGGHPVPAPRRGPSPSLGLHPSPLAPSLLPPAAPPPSPSTPAAPSPPEGPLGLRSPKHWVRSICTGPSAAVTAARNSPGPVCLSAYLLPWEDKTAAGASQHVPAADGTVRTDALSLLRRLSKVPLCLRLAVDPGKPHALSVLFPLMSAEGLGLPERLRPHCPAPTLTAQ